jgi:hypothetical protein
MIPLGNQAPHKTPRARFGNPAHSRNRLDKIKGCKKPNETTPQLAENHGKTKSRREAVVRKGKGGLTPPPRPPREMLLKWWPSVISPSRLAKPPLAAAARQNSPNSFSCDLERASDLQRCAVRELRVERRRLCFSVRGGGARRVHIGVGTGESGPGLTCGVALSRANQRVQNRV